MKGDGIKLYVQGDMYNMYLTTEFGRSCVFGRFFV